MSTKPKVFGHLLIDVIRSNRCVACGSCISVCPVDAITMVDSVPKLTGKCTVCGDCYLSCPRAVHDLPNLEREVLGRQRKPVEVIGVLKGAYAVRSTQPMVKTKAQDGGAVTAVLTSFLRKNGDAVIVAGLEKSRPWHPTPILTTNEAEVLDSAGTKYTSTPMVLSLKEAEKRGLLKTALVGTPCQIHALRRRQCIIRASQIEGPSIGLFCMETFEYDQLMSFLREQGIDPSSVKKFEIKSGKFIAHVEGGEPYEMRVRKLKELSRTCCKTCLDYTSELADLSVGNVGSPEGWSTVLVRTERGEKVLKEAEDAGLLEIKPLSDFEPGLELVIKLSDMKKKERSS